MPSAVPIAKTSWPMRTLPVVPSVSTGCVLSIADSFRTAMSTCGAVASTRAGTTSPDARRTVTELLRPTTCTFVSSVSGATKNPLPRLPDASTRTIAGMTRPTMFSNRGGSTGTVSRCGQRMVRPAGDLLGRDIRRLSPGGCELVIRRNGTRSRLRRRLRRGRRCGCCHRHRRRPLDGGSRAAPQRPERNSARGRDDDESRPEQASMTAGVGNLRDPGCATRHHRCEVGAAPTDLDRLRNSPGTRRTDAGKDRHVCFFGRTPLVV